MSNISKASYAVRTILLAMLLCRCHVAPAQPPQPLPQFEIQSKNGFRLRLTRAAWDNFDTLMLRQSRFAGKGLTLYYAAERDFEPYTGELNGQVVEVEARGPHGEPVQALRDQAFRVLLSGVNPYWETLHVTFTLLDPNVDANLARGRAFNLLNFENVTLPTRIGEALAPNLTQSGRLGTEVTLRRIVLEEESRRVVYKFEAEFVAPENAPDALIQPVAGGNSAQAATDGASRRRGLRSRQIPTTPQDPRRQIWEYSIEQRQLNAGGNETPEAVHLNLRLMETAPSLQLVEAMHRFEFELPLGELEDRSNPRHLPTSPPVRAAGAEVEVEVEDWGTEWAPQPKQNLLRVWAKTLDARSPARWLVQSARIGSAPQPTRFLPSPLDAWSSGWKANGEAAGPDEHSFDLFATLPARTSAPTPRPELTVELAEATRTIYSLDLDNLPRPNSDKVETINRVARDGSGAEFEVRALANFSQSHLPAGWPAPLQSSPPIATGIALSCRWKPAGGTRATVASALVNATDAQGRALTYAPLQLLLQTSGAQWHLNAMRPIKLDASTPQDEYEFTLLLLPPAPDAESLNLSLFAEEIIPTGKKQTVKVPLP